MGFDIFLPQITTPDPSVPPTSTERNITRQKRNWLKTPCAAQLSIIVSRITASRSSSPISNIVCLGLGGYARWASRDNDQYIAFSQIVRQLSLAYPDILNHIVVQDPEMKKGMEEYFKGHGCRVVDDPEAFRYVGPNTALFNWFVAILTLLQGLMGQEVQDLAMYVGPDLRRSIDTWESTYGMFRLGIREADVSFYAAKARAMLDATQCERETLPVGPLSFWGWETTPGLRNVEIWWRPIDDGAVAPE